MHQLSPVAQYCAQVDDKWRPLIEEVSQMIIAWYPDLLIEIWHSMGYDIIGWGQATYKLASGQSNKWFIVGLSAHKNYCSLYIWGYEDDQSLLEKYQAKLGRVKIGKACLNFKSLADINWDGTRFVIDLAIEQATFYKMPKNS